MSSWVSLLLKLVSVVGIPVAKMIFPKVGEEVWNLILEILGHIKTSSDKPTAVRQIQDKVRECTGVGCAADTKSL